MIDRGEIVAIAADRLPEGDAEQGIPARFLGAPALFPRGPFILASILKCPVFTAFCTRTPEGRYLLDVEPFANPLRLPRKQRNEHLNRVVQSYAHRLESICQRSPLEWFNFFKFWQMPEGQKE